MRRLLLAAPFALIPLLAIADEHDHMAHDSLAAHEHGSGQLNVALDQQTLELELKSPAINLLGFEHAASTTEEHAKVAEVARQLADPIDLFSLAEGQCSLTAKDIEGPMFAADKPHDHADEEHAHKEGEAAHQHSDIHAQYRLDCQQSDALAELDLTELFKRFPGMHKIQLQLIGPSGQKGAQLSPDNATANF